MSKYIALVHHPIVDKTGKTVTTSVTNLDIHDIARSARTFGFDGYFIVTPIEKQHALVKNILNHWNTDHGNQYNPDRKDALSFIRLVSTIEEAQAQILEQTQKKAFTVVTGANFKEFEGNKEQLDAALAVDNSPMLLLFGTGWGLHTSVVEKADFRLGPIFGAAKDGYNHLSVRSAVAIYCDRLHRSL